MSAKPPGWVPSPAPSLVPDSPDALAPLPPRPLAPGETDVQVGRIEFLGKTPEQDTADEQRFLELYKAAGQVPMDQQASINALNDLGVPADVAKDNLDVLRGALDKSPDPRAWINDHPELWDKLKANPQLAGLVTRDEDIGTFKKRLRLVSDIAGTLVDGIFTGQQPTEADAQRLSSEFLAAEIPDWFLSLTGGKEALAAYHEHARPLQVLVHENPAQGMEALSQIWGHGVKTLEHTELSFQLLRQDLSYLATDNPEWKDAADSTEFRMRKLRDEMGFPQRYNLSGVTGFAASALENLFQFAPLLGKTLEGGALGAVAVGTAAAGAAAVTGGAALPAFLPAAAAGFGWGAFVAGFEGASRQTMGDLYLNLRNATDEQGQPIDRRLAIAGSILGGLGVAGLMQLGLGAKLEALGVDAISTPAMLRLIGGTQKTLLGKIAAKTINNIAVSVPDVMAQQALQLYTDWQVRELSASEHQHFDFGGAAVALTDAGQAAVFSSLLMAPGTTAVEAVKRTGVAKAAVRGLVKAGVILDTLQGEAKNFPKDTADIIRTTEPDRVGGTEHLYLDPLALLDEIKKQGDNPDTIAKRFFGEDGIRRVEEALRDRDPDAPASLRVPVSEIALRIAHDDKYFEPLLKHFTALENGVGQEGANRIVEDARAAINASGPETLLSEAQSKETYLAFPTEEQSRLYHLDRDTGVMNARSFWSLPPDPEKPMAAIFDFEGIKWGNIEGHEHGDSLLRAVATALHSVNPEVARTPEGFPIRVRGVREAKQILKAVKRQLPEGLRKLNITYTLSELTPQAFVEAKARAGEAKAAAEAAGKRAPRGSKPLGLKVNALSELGLSSAPVQAQIPQSLQEAFANLPPEQAFRDIHIEKGTGVYTGLGFDLLPKNGAVTVFDLNAIQVINDELGKAAGDAAIYLFTKAMKETGGLGKNAAHLHGDEFAGGNSGHTVEQMDAWAVDNLRQAAEDITLHAVQGSDLIVWNGLGFEHGTHEGNIHEADTILSGKKAKREAELKAAGQDKRSAEIAKRLRRIPLDSPKAKAYLDQLARSGTDVRAGWGTVTRGGAKLPGEAGGPAPSPKIRAIAEHEAHQILGAPLDEGLFSPAEYEAYLKRRDASVTAAALAMERRKAANEAQMATKEYRQQVAENRPKAEEEWANRKGWRAWKYLKSGEVRMEDGTFLTLGEGREGAAGKLDREAVEGLLGKDHPLISKLRGRLVEEGESPFDVAKMHGFDGPIQMFGEALKDANTNPKEWVRRRAEDLTLAEHQDLADSVISLHEVAREVLRNKGNISWLNESIDKLKGEAPHLVSEEVSKAQARAYVDNQTIGEISAQKHLDRERSAMAKATKEATKGNFARAAEYLHRQRYNMEKWRRAKQVEKEITRFRSDVEDLRKIPARQMLGKASPAHRDVVDSLIEALGYRPVAENTPEHGLSELQGIMRSSGDDPSFDANLLEQLLRRPKNWRDLKVNEMREVHAALKEIQASARKTTKTAYQGRLVDKATLLAQFKADAEDSKMVKKRETLPPDNPASMTTTEKARSVASSLDTFLLKPATYMEWMGPSWEEAFIGRLSDSSGTYYDLATEHGKPVIEAFEKVPSDTLRRFSEKVDGHKFFPNHRTDVSPPRTVLDLLMLTLYRGADSNIERLEKGRGITTKQLDQALAAAQLPKSAYDWVQSIWDSSESLWPKVRALEERYTGTAPEKLKLRKFTVQTSEGPVEMRGGYFHASYDSRVSMVGEAQQAEQVVAAMPSYFNRPGTRREHTRARAVNFADAVSMNPRNIQRDFLNVIHDLAFREALRDTASLAFDPQTKALMTQYLGPEKYRSFTQWLRDIGQNGSGVDPHLLGLGPYLGALRSNYITSVLGYRIGLPLADLTGFAVAPLVSDMSVRHVFVGLEHYIKDPSGVGEIVTTKSSFMRSRPESVRYGYERFVRDVASSQAVPAKVLRAYKDHAWYFFEATDKITSQALWYGAYKQATEIKGLGEHEAIRFADKVIQKTLPSFRLMDMAPAQRSQLVKTMFAFLGYFNVLHQARRSMLQEVMVSKVPLPANRSLLKEYPTERSKAQTSLAVAKAAGKLLALEMTVSVFAELVSGNGPEKDEKWLDWMSRKLMVGPFTGIPGVTGAVEAFALKRQPSSRNAPGLAALEDIARAAAKFSNPEKGRDAIIRGAGGLLGIPQRPTKALLYYWDLVDRQKEGTLPEKLAAPIWGPERRGANPITMMER